MTKKQIKELLDFIESQNRAMCTESRKQYRNRIERILQDETNNTRNKIR